MIKIVSDFKDYYDYVSTDDSAIVYNRTRRLFKSRGEELNYLRNNGINTVKFGPLIKFGVNIGKFVVYTNPAQHSCSGKHIYTRREVESMYPNYVLSEFLEQYNGYTVKYLQIGERRFRMMFYNQNYLTSLEEGVMVAVEELPRQYNYAIGIPIYSIDYVSNGSEMVAIDFNEVQQLDKIGVDKIISAKDVAMEVKKALIAYNKA